MKLDFVFCIYFVILLCLIVKFNVKGWKSTQTGCVYYVLERVAIKKRSLIIKSLLNL